MTAVFQRLADFSRTECMANGPPGLFVGKWLAITLSSVTNEHGLHPTATGYNRVAELYEQARSDYPLQLLDHLDALHPITAKSRVRNALKVTDEAEFPLPLQLQTWSTRRL